MDSTMMVDPSWVHRKAIPPTKRYSQSAISWILGMLSRMWWIL